MTRKIYPLTETDIYKPINGFSGFAIHDRKHRTINSHLDNAELYAGFVGPVGGDWLEINLTETTIDRNGRARNKQISVLLKRDEMLALRDTINAVLNK